MTNRKRPAAERLRKKEAAELTQEELWDDSLIIDQVTELEDEYKYYHSLQVNSDHEEIQRILDEAEQIEANATEGAISNGQIDATSNGEITERGVEAEDGEVEDDVPMDEDDVEEHVDSNKHLGDADGVSQTVAGASMNTEKSLPNPTELFSRASTQPDENMKNLVMSWYWAGYYSGFYEGQKASRSNPAS